MIDTVPRPASPETMRVDELEKQFPQEVVSNFELATEVDGQILISCLEPGQQLSNQASKLSNREYQCLLLLATGMSYKEIAQVLPKNPRIGDDLSVSTVRAHLHNIYQTLGVMDRSQASQFVPVPEKTIRETEAFQADEFGGFASLTLKQAEVFEMMGDGLYVKEIAAEMVTTPSTVRTHLHKIAVTLGLKNGHRDISGQIRRLSVAHRNWIEFGDITTETAVVLHPHVTNVLSGVEEADSNGQIDLDKPDAVHTISNEELLAELEDGGFLPGRESRDRGKLDLSGVIAAILLKRATTADYMKRKPAQPIAREIIRREVDLFYRARERS